MYTEFKGFITLEITEDDLETPNRSYNDSIGGNRTVTVFRSRIKIPQKSNRNQGINNMRYSHLWRNEYFTFSANTIYSVAKFNPVVVNENSTDNAIGNVGYEYRDDVNTLRRDPYFSVGIIKTTEDENEMYEFPSNGFTDRDKPVFGTNWLNFSIYLPQIGYTPSSEFGNLRVNTYFEAFKFYDDIGYNKPYGRYEFLKDNNEPIAGSETNTKWFLRSDLHWTDFIIVPENDIKVFNGFSKKGGDDQDNYFNEVGTKISITNYMSGSKPCPIGGGKRLGIPSNNVDPKIYFYKGLDSADCIEFVSDVLNIL